MLRGVESSLVTAIAEGLAVGEYSVLTGAGAATAARSSDGRPLPTSPALRSELLKAFSLPAGAEDAPLASVFQRIRTTQPSVLIDFLRERFFDCQPAEAHRRLVRLPWQRIWTLNVDDVIEIAAQEMGVRHTSIHVTHDRGARADRDSVEVVHLHGAVRDVLQGLDEDLPASAALERLVFDWQSYGRRAAASPTWQQRFEDDFAETPFVVIGARMVDEPDLWRLFERTMGASPNDEHPSVVVVSEVSEFDRARLESEFQLQVLQQDADTFTKSLEDEYHRTLARQTETLSAPVSASHIAFLQQFDDLRRKRADVESPAARTRFYQGWEPTWPVVRTLRADADFDATRHLSNIVIERLKSTETEPVLYLLTGGPGTGKSTALLRVAADALDAGFSPWLFRENERLRVESAVDWTARQATALLLFDDLAEFAPDVGEALTQAKARGTRLTILAAIRDQRLRHAIDKVGDGARPEELALGTLTQADVRGLIDKLEPAGLMGSLSRRNWREREWFFLRQHRGQLFSALAELTEGPGFAARIKSTFENLGQQERAIVTPVALTHNFGFPLRVAFVGRIAGRTPGEVRNVVEQNLQGLVVKDPAGLRLTHRIVAALLLQECLDTEERFRLAKDVSESLAPHVDRKQLVNQSRASRIVRALFTARNVRWLCGPEHGEDFYASLEDSYGWNGRFWDQRAIWHLEQNDLNLARNYAEKSVAVHRHPFALTLLGQTLFAVARRDGDGEMLVAGEEALRQARDGFTNWRYWAEDDKPFEVFFDGLLQFRAQWGPMLVPAVVARQWAEWVARAKTSRIPSVLQKLDKWQDHWSGAGQYDGPA